MYLTLQNCTLKVKWYIYHCYRKEKGEKDTVTEKEKGHLGLAITHLKSSLLQENTLHSFRPASGEAVLSLPSSLLRAQSPRGTEVYCGHRSWGGGAHSPCHPSREQQCSLPLPTTGLCLSVLLVQSRLRESSSQCERQGNCRDKEKQSRQEANEQLEKKVKP